VDAASHEDLLDRIGRFEEALRSAWDVDRPGLPRHLKGYRAAWLRTLAAPLAPGSRGDLRDALQADHPLLVSDYHPLPRARRDLAAALDLLPPERPVVLVLELLPAGRTLSARAALRDDRVRLATGALLRDAYRPALEALARRDGTVVGAWSERPAVQRDSAAAALWQAAARPEQDAQWVFHFGDWHLADDHLPARLREAGAAPVVLHLSPEPVWQRVGLRPERMVYRLGGADRHWVWLRTPPPGLWASQLTEAEHVEDEELSEGCEHLVESLVETWCRALGLAEPAARLGVHGRGDWDDFHALLPAAQRTLYPAAPHLPLFHPHLPLLWLPEAPALNTLVEASQHVLSCDAPLRDGDATQDALHRQAWRSMGAALVNPFLRAPRWLEMARGLWPDAAPGALVDRARASDPARGGNGRMADTTVDPQLAALQARVWGARCGVALASAERLDTAFLQAFLQSPAETLEPEVLTATIRAA